MQLAKEKLPQLDEFRNFILYKEFGDMIEDRLKITDIILY